MSAFKIYQKLQNHEPALTHDHADILEHITDKQTDRQLCHYDLPMEELHDSLTPRSEDDFGFSEEGLDLGWLLANSGNFCLPVDAFFLSSLLSNGTINAGNTGPISPAYIFVRGAVPSFTIDYITL